LSGGRCAGRVVDGGRSWRRSLGKLCVALGDGARDLRGDALARNGAGPLGSRIEGLLFPHVDPAVVAAPWPVVFDVGGCFAAVESPP